MCLKLLEKHVKHGTLDLHMPDGTVHTFGDNAKPVNWSIRSEQAINRIARDWEFEHGRTYMEGGWEADPGELRNMLGLLRTNFAARPSSKRANRLLSAWQHVNSIRRSYRHIAHHYDTDESIFRLFLDSEMYYSCAFFNSPGDSIEQAQQNKAAIIARKLLLKPDMTVLDIGCGWGSLAFHLVTHHSVNVTGITLSNEQLRVAQEEARRHGISDRCRFLLVDYREHEARYDRIVSVSMLEHVGVDNFGTYFSRINTMLAEDGVALVHTMANKSVPQPTNPWITRCIFPGGRIPAVSETAAGIEKSRLMLTDLEVWRMQYAWTLRRWLERFQAHREEILAIKDEAFYRMWKFYLAVCDMSFEFANLIVIQCQLAKTHGVVPVSRNYLLMQDAETDP